MDPNPMLLRHIIRSDDIMAATAEGVYGKKSSPKCERERQLAICIEQRDFLRPLVIPATLKRNYEAVMERLEEAIEYFVQK